MNFNAFGIKVTMTAALAAGTMVIGSMPAQAASIAGKTLAFYGSAQLELDTINPNPDKFILNFTPTYVEKTGQASVADASDIGRYNQQFTLADIPLLKTATGWNFMGSLDWIKADAGLKYRAPGESAEMAVAVSYTLTSFQLAKTTNGFEAVIQGLFNPGGLSTVEGLFSSQKRLATINGTSFSADLTASDAAAPGSGSAAAVPTPVLLPGQLGLGVTAWRKRQSKSIAA